MTVQPPTKISDAAPEKPTENKFKPFQPEMPQIPGVTDGSRHAKQGLNTNRSQKPLQIGAMLVAVVFVGALIMWWAKTKTGGVASPAPDSDSADQTVPAPPIPSPVASVPEGPVVAATVEELSKPWSAKKFAFVKPFTRENVNAMVIRLPGGGLWAFSLKGPFGQCELEFVTDLPTLSTKYRFNASHPMVVNPCDGTVYDPLKVGDIGGNTWVRGEIVQGSSLRPPLSIDVKVSGRSIVAENME